MPRFLRGRDDRVRDPEGATYAELPAKFEAGTVNAAGAVGLEAAIDYVRNVGFEEIVRHDNALASFLMEGMKDIPAVHVIGSPDGNRHCGIVTFTIDGVHPHDIATVLDTEPLRSAWASLAPAWRVLGVRQQTGKLLLIRKRSLSFFSTMKHVRKWMGYGN